MKRHCTRRILSILLVLVLTFSLLPAGAFTAADGDVTISIIHVNDRHGRMSADPYISQLAKNTSGNVLILDGGDALHGQITTNLSKGEAMAELMNEVGYSAMVTGNHEYTYGVERLLELSEMMDFPLLAANVKNTEGENLFESCAIFPMEGVTVGVFGIVTPETVGASDPRNMEGLIFEDPVQTAEAEVAELEAMGCGIIIALTHLGLDDLSDPANRSDALANVPGIDVIIDGHSHTKLPTGRFVGDTLIAQTGEYGQDIGVVEISISGGRVSKTARLVPVPADGAPSELVADGTILAKIAELDAEYEAETSVVVGNTPVFMQGGKTESRVGETNLADLITDSMRWVTGADMAFMTGGNIRASIDAGDITMGEVLTTLPYSNLITTVELTGADLLKILEHGVDTYPEAVGHYIHVSGLKFTFDPEAASGSRVKAVTMSDGNALVLDKTYVVATIDFIAAGGDGYDMMERGKNLVYYGGDAETLVDYLAESPVISGEPGHRVTITYTAGNIEKSVNETGEFKIVLPEKQGHATVNIPISAMGSGMLVIETGFGMLSLPNAALVCLSELYGDTLRLCVTGDGFKVGVLDEADNEISHSDADHPLRITMPYALEDGQISQAVIVTGKDGKIFPFSVCKDGSISFEITETGTYNMDYNKKSFSDVSLHWAEDYIDFAAARSLCAGDSNGNFSPDASITRATFVQMLANLNGADLSGYQTSRFGDVPVSQLYTPAVEWAADKGLVIGVGNGNFEPERSITREEMALILDNYMKYMGYALPTGGVTAFSDEAQISTWAYDAVKAIQAVGVVLGKPGSAFDPQSAATRAESAAILARFVEKALG